MIEQLTPIVNELLLMAFSVAAVFVRLGAMCMLAPGIGEKSLPMRVKLALAVALSLFLAPLVPGAGPTLSFQMIFTEVTVGVFLGLLLRLFVHGLQVAGTIAAQSTSLSQMMGASNVVDPQPAVSAFLVLAGITYFAILGLHVQFVAYALQSYNLVPFGHMLSAELAGRVGLAQIQTCFYLGFTLSAPFVLGSLVYNLLIGFVNRAMPQLMVSFVGAPAVTFGGMMLLMLCGSGILTVWSDAVALFMLNPESLR